MTTKYEYELINGIERNLVPCQEKKLLEKGFIFNDRLKTWDKYDVEMEEKISYQLRYIKSETLDLPLNKYSFKKLIRGNFKVTYSKIESNQGFFGFLKNIVKKIFKTTELDIKQERVDELTEMQAEGKISGLSVVIMPKIELTKVDLTEDEFLEKINNGEKIFLEKKSVGFKRGIRNIEGETLIEKKLFSEFIKDKKELERTEIKELIEKTRTLVDQRDVVVSDEVYYIPGFWSRKQKSGSLDMSGANFNCRVSIQYISGFSPFDPDCFKKKELIEEIIGIIEVEHPNSVHIRKRNDKVDGFKVEKHNIK